MVPYCRAFARGRDVVALMSCYLAPRLGPALSHSHLNACCISRGMDLRADIELVGDVLGR